MTPFFDSLSEWFSQSGFMPHGHCYLWKPALIWSHFGSDILIGGAYVSISLSLYLLVRRIRLPFSTMFLAFGAFIGFCGLTHFMEAWNLWYSDYWASAGIKIVTAAASLATAILMYPLAPKVYEIAQAARLSEERKIELEALYRRLKEMDEAKTQFFSNVSHELRTPLTLIQGPLESVLHSQALDPTERHELEVALRNSRTLLKQVNDLLDISKIEAGRMGTCYAECDAGKLVRIMAAHFESLLASRRIRLDVVTPQTLPVEVDPEKTQRILMNLLSNAAKFTPEDGWVRLELEDAGSSFKLVISDNGPGIPENQRQAVFERFIQLDGGATRKTGGTGLGLAIVRDFTEIQGGRVEVTAAEEGGGSRFVVTLPKKAPPGARVERSNTISLADSESEAHLRGTLEELHIASAEGFPARKRSPEGEAASPRPLVVVCEDNAEMNLFLAETLAADFEIISAFNGRQGLREIQTRHPDLVITDIMMPEMSGDQLVRELRSRPEFDMTPVLVLSAKADDELRVELLKNGAQDFLLKPFSRHELIARARNLTQMKRTRDVLSGELATRSNDIEKLAKEVTVRKREVEIALETSHIAQERAERANLAKSHFLGLVSHELKTPLTTIDMNLQLLKRLRPQAFPEKIEKCLDRATSGTTQLKNLIEGLLEYTHLESGRITLEPELIHVGSFLSERLDACRIQAELKGLELIVDAPNDLAPLFTDRRLLDIIVNNLMGNAIKFTEQGRVQVSIQAEGDLHTIRVTDTGPGIPLEDQSRIFEPFEQLQPIRRKSIPGIGLGLSLVNEIVRALDGKVEVHSTVGQGTTFSVTLPPCRLETKEFAFGRY